MVHELKILPEYAALALQGYKPWELRLNDRDYKVGDKIIFTAEDHQQKEITIFERLITYVFQGGQYGLDKDHVILTLAKEI